MSYTRFFIFFILAGVFALNQWAGEPSMMRGTFFAYTLGGPDPLLGEEGTAAEPQVKYDFASPLDQTLTDPDSDIFPWHFDDTLGGAANPSNEALEWMAYKYDVIEHIVQEGDTVFGIAGVYGVSAETIMWANGLNPASVLKLGDKLEFPSVSGVLHRVKQGDTISGIASRYGVPIERIIAANAGESPENLKTGTDIIVPGGKPAPKAGSPTYYPPRTITAGSVSTLGYFIAPTVGVNWGVPHYYNATDIANACGTPVWAAASGVVVWTGWSGSYGNLIRISHPNGAETGYAHLSRISVSVGAPVSQGDIIGYIGNTGRVRGITGCHLHFEVRGGVNPFIRYR